MIVTKHFLGIFTYIFSLGVRPTKKYKWRYPGNITAIKVRVLISRLVYCQPFVVLGEQRSGTLPDDHTRHHAISMRESSQKEMRTIIDVHLLQGKQRTDNPSKKIKPELEKTVDMCAQRRFRWAWTVGLSNLSFRSPPEEDLELQDFRTVMQTTNDV